MSTVTRVAPNRVTQELAAWTDAVDSTAQVHDRVAGPFAAHEQSTPVMTVRLDAGAILNGVTLTEVAAQSTGVITAPVSNPRIDRVVVDNTTGVVSVITGSEGASPSAPAIATGKLPVCQVLLATSSTEITNSMITDERVPFVISESYAAGTAVEITTGTETALRSWAPDVLNDAISTLLAGGSTIDIQTFTASDTWTKPSSGTIALIECWGAGGSGGVGLATVGGGGGGGGGYSSKIILLSSLGATETVTIGAGGAAKASADTAGSAGGNTTFGAHLTAYGGGAGNRQGSGWRTGGGGGGQLSAGANGPDSTTLGGAGGGPSGGVPVASAIGTNGAGGGAGGGTNLAGGDGFYGGGGGGGGDSSGVGQDGGDSFYGGGGGGGGGESVAGGAGGSSVRGGAGGAGAIDAATATSGTQPGGGGGGAETGTSGAGADGQVKVTVW